MMGCTRVAVQLRAEMNDDPLCCWCVVAKGLTTGRRRMLSREKATLS